MQMEAMLHQGCCGGQVVKAPGSGAAAVKVCREGSFLSALLPSWLTERRRSPSPPARRTCRARPCLECLTWSHTFACLYMCKQNT